jgi:hypothetical protein
MMVVLGALKILRSYVKAMFSSAAFRPTFGEAYDHHNYFLE